MNLNQIYDILALIHKGQKIYGSGGRRRNASAKPQGGASEEDELTNKFKELQEKRNAVEEIQITKGQAASIAIGKIAEYINKGIDLWFEIQGKFEALNHNISKVVAETTEDFSKIRRTEQFGVLEKELNTEVENFKQQMGIAFNAYSKTANTLAYEAYTASIEIEERNRKLALEKRYLRDTRAIQEKEATTRHGYDIKKQSQERQMYKEELWMKPASLASSMLLGAATGGLISGPFAPVGAAIGALGGIAVHLWARYNELQSKRLDREKDTAEKYAAAEKALREDALKRLKEAEQKKIEQEIELQKKYAKLTEDVGKIIENINKLSSDTAAHFGMSASGMDALTKSAFMIGTEVASKYGKGTEDVLKEMQTYSDKIHRQVFFSAEDADALFAFQKKAGNNAMDIVSKMFIFNKGIKDSAEMTNTMMQKAVKAGISQNDYVKSVADNLRLAQKYNFKEGVQSVMEMSIWAERTRFSMESIGNIVDGLQEGGIENVLTKSAQLQVLGGNAAIYSDPFGMLYEAFNDPQALAERYQNMTRGMGTFNEDIGEVQFSGSETMMINAIAKAQGRNKEELRNEILERNKREMIERQVGGKYSEQELTRISAGSFFDTASKSWKVNVLDASGKTVAKGADKLTETDLERIRVGDSTENIATDVSKILSIMERQEGARKKARERLGQKTYDITLKESDKRTKIMSDAYRRAENEMVQHITGAQVDSTEALNDIADILSSPEEANKAILTNMTMIQNKIQQVATLEQQILNTMMLNKEGKRYLGKAMNDIYSTNATAEEHTFMANELNTALARGNMSGMSSQTRKIVSKYFDDIMEGMPVKDGIISGNVVGVGTSVTPINDGVVGFSTHQDDTAIVGKKGGPFDSIINGSMNNKLSAILSMMPSIAKGEDTNNTANGYFNLNIGGDIKVNGDSSIGNVLLHDEAFIQGIVKIIIDRLSENQNFGRGELYKKRWSNV